MRRLFGFLLLIATGALAQTNPPYAPDRRPGEGEGPFPRLIIRGATLVDGTGAPPIGPVDIVIEGNRIREVRSVGFPGVPIKEDDRPKNATREIDASGLWVLPGFVDLHAHPGGREQGTTAEYVYKLWLAHGVTTVRDPGCGNGVDWCLHERERSARNAIVAPRIVPYVFTTRRQWDGGPLDSPEQARKFVQWAAKKGIEGLKVFGSGDPVYEPDILSALLDEARRQGLGSTAHIAQIGVARTNILQAARMGLRGMEHWYGLPESLFAARTVQDFPLHYNYNDEQHRFGEAGRLWKQAAAPGSEKWNAVIDELASLRFNIDPTLTIYEASRDLMRAMRAEWHDRYTLPSLWQFYQPSRAAHGSYWFDWTTRDEIEWKNNYRIWMQFLNDYKNRGGRVTTGSDSGFIFKLYGFDYIRELELLQEAGFHPLEVIRAATLWGAEALRGERAEFGSVRPGKLADLVFVDQNPVANLKVLYGTGWIRVNDQTGAVERVGGVKWVMKDGILYDAKQLLRDVEQMVAAAKGLRAFSPAQRGEGTPRPSVALGPQGLVALAGAHLQHLAVEDDHRLPALADGAGGGEIVQSIFGLAGRDAEEAGRRRRVNGDLHGRAAVVHHQEPARQTRLRTMMTAAGAVLGHLREILAGVAQDRVVQAAPAIELMPEVIGGHAESRSGASYHHLVRASFSLRQRAASHHSLAPDQAELELAAVPKPAHHSQNHVDGEQNMFEGRAGGHEHPSSRRSDHHRGPLDGVALMHRETGQKGVLGESVLWLDGGHTALLAR